MNTWRKVGCLIIAAVAAFGVFADRESADTFTWKACVDGDFETDANWTTASGNPGHPELVGDIVVLPKFAGDNSYTVTVKSPFTIGSLTVGDVDSVAGACTATLVFKTLDQQSKVCGNVLVKADGIITHYGPANTQTDALNLQVGGDCTVETDGIIHADSKGYTGSSGCGPGGAAGLHGASHAGQGSGAKGGPYGSVLRPVTWGSNTSQCTGGGAIHLDVKGTLTVDGRVSANGANPHVNYTSCGGSVWIECASLVGSGRIEARDGFYTGTNQQKDWTSSGGRIAVYQHTATGFSAFPVTQMATVQNGLNAAGTIYLESVGSRDLYVIGGAKDAPQKTPFPMPDDGDDLAQYADLNVHVSGYAHLSVCDLMMPAMTLPIHSLEVANNAMMTIGAGSALQVSGDIDTTGAKSVTGGVIEFVGEGAATVLGASKIASFEAIVCTNAGKTIAFGTAAADKLTVGVGMDFVVKGAEEAPVSLVSTSGGTPWFLSVNSNPGTVVIDHVAVRDSDASSGASVLAISSTDLGNNSNWGFSDPIVPGETITWTGEQSAKWDAAENWDRGRAPVETDRVVIPAGTANYPTLASGTYLFNSVGVSSGAEFTLASGCELTVTNDLTVAGAIAFTGGEDLYLAGNANFTGGSVTKANGKIHLVGTADQTVDFGDTTIFKVYSEKPSGNVSFGAHGFTADAFVCSASTPITFTFAAGETYTVPALSLGSIGADRQVKLVSSVPGVAWKLVTSASDQSVSGVEAHDSDASEGATVMAGTKSVALDRCTNWDTVTSVALWLGGSGDWTDPTKWSTGEVPGETESVTVSAADGEELTVTVPAEMAAHVKSLTVLAGIGGKATFVANGTLTVEADLDIRANGVVEMNAFNDAGDAPNVVKGNALVHAGGVLSHTGPNDAEVRKLHLMVMGDMTVDAEGAVDVECKGYSVNHGPGTVRCGPMHAATATKYCNNGTWTAEKHCYGSIRRPVSYGSGSGGISGMNNNGANGGGVANLQIGGTLLVNGAVSAVGGTTGNYPGAGGSVFIRCSVLAGSGTVKAHGNKLSSDANCSSAGGRIAIYQTKASDLSAFSGRVTTMYPGSYSSACGTIYYEFADDPANEGLLVIDNGGYDRKHDAAWDGDVYPHTMFGAFMEDVGIPFGEIVVTNKGSLMADTGIPIKVTRKLAVSSDSEILGSVIDFRGADEAIFVGASRCAIDALICTNAGKVVRFGTGENDMPVIAAGKSLVLKGEDENPVALLPLDGAATWKVAVDANASVDVRYVAVSNSTSVSAPINAVNSHNLGGNNEKWVFIEEIVPGEEIVWVGAKSTDWMDPLNWDRRRCPVVTDSILINALGDGVNYPTLGNSSAFEQITVGAGATFTLNGCDLTVSNKLTVAGTFVFAGAERLRLVRDADFTGAQVVKGGSNILLEGDEAQVVNFADCTLHCLNIAKNSGTVAFTGGFAADILRCNPAGALTLEFSNGVTIRANDLCLYAGDAPLTLAGSGWNLWATEDRQAVANVKVSGCTATGATIYAGKSSTDAGGNSGWDFDAETGVWIGGDGDWTDATHWAGGQIPSLEARVTLAVAEKEQVKVTIPANSAVQVKTLTLRGDAGGCATVIANSPLTAESLDLCENGVLELNCYDDDGEAPNVVTGDVLVRNGGRITHTGPAATENAKLHLKVIGDVTIEKDGTIDADAKGYSKGTGPGKTTAILKGAAHAGWGNDNEAEPYGSVLAPVTWGSSPYMVGTTIGGCGGGAVHLVVTGTLTVNGRISSDGGVSDVYAGAGGSVWIECARLVGSGALSVTEGRRNSTTGFLLECTSSGGRIAVYQTAAKDFSAFPVSQMHTSWLGKNAAGTIWLQGADPRSFCELHVELGSWAVNDAACKTELVMADDAARLDAYKYAKIFVTGTPYASVSFDFTALDLMLEASDAAGKKVPHVYLNGKTMKIRSMKHVNGRKWFKSYDAAVESGYIVKGGTDLNPGKIEWVGGASGLMLMVK